MHERYSMKVKDGFISEVYAHVQALDEWKHGWMQMCKESLEHRWMKRCSGRIPIVILNTNWSMKEMDGETFFMSTKNYIARSLIGTGEYGCEWSLDSCPNKVWRNKWRQHKLLDRVHRDGWASLSTEADELVQISLDNCCLTFKFYLPPEFYQLTELTRDSQG